MSQPAPVAASTRAAPAFSSVCQHTCSPSPAIDLYFLFISDSSASHKLAFHSIMQLLGNECDRCCGLALGTPFSLELRLVRALKRRLLALCRPHSPPRNRTEQHCSNHSERKPQPLREWAVNLCLAKDSGADAATERDTKTSFVKSKRQWQHGEMWDQGCSPDVTLNRESCVE